jgi:flavin reductase (DIM6/NTAB) family NADH-FMN oxidoreductase RutF
MNEKITIDLSKSYNLLHPRNTVLITSRGEDDRTNIVAIAWCMPVSIHPPLVVMSVDTGHYSNDLIQESGEFVVNIPTMDVVTETLLCGRMSGRNVDKFEASHFTPMKGAKVRTPLIKECVAHLECKLVRRMPLEDVNLYIGEVVAASANRGSLINNVIDVEKVRLVFHIGKDEFVTNDSRVVTPKSS